MDEAREWRNAVDSQSEGDFIIMGERWLFGGIAWRSLCWLSLATSDRLAAKHKQKTMVRRATVWHASSGD